MHLYQCNYCTGIDDWLVLISTIGMGSLRKPLLCTNTPGRPWVRCDSRHVWAVNPMKSFRQTIQRKQVPSHFSQGVSLSRTVTLRCKLKWQRIKDMVFRSDGSQQCWSAKVLSAWKYPVPIVMALPIGKPSFVLLIDHMVLPLINGRPVYNPETALYIHAERKLTSVGWWC